VTLWLLAIGAISMLGQVVLLRELNVAFFGSELVYVLALAVWLFGTAAGALSGRASHDPGERAVRWLLVVLGLAIPSTVLLARAMRIVFGGVPGAYLPFGRQMLAMIACVVPVAFLLGLLFQWAAKLFIGAGRRLAGAYAVESAGGVAGGILATALIAAGAPNLAGALWCAAAAFGAAIWPLRHDARGPRAAAVTGLACAVAALWAGGAIDTRTTAWNHPRLLATRDTPYGRVTVTEAAGQIAVFENDALAYESQGTAAEEFVHLAAMQRDRPRAVLILGGAAQGLVGEALDERPARVDDFEMDRALVDLVAPYLPESARHALADPRARITFGDPRRLLERAGIYDLILVGLPEPESGRTNRYYTREFFALCARHLGRGGVLAARLRGAENLWTPPLAGRATSIDRALRSAFADVVVLPGVTNLFLASRSALVRDPEVLGERLRQRELGTRLVTPAYVRYLYTNDRFAEAAAVVARTAVPANSDARPFCYQATMVLWLARFFPRLTRLDVPEFEPTSLPRSPAAWGCGAILLVTLVVARRRPTLRRALLAGASGFAGMALEAVLLLQYQTRSGVLFQDLGVLLTAFMAGLAAGAVALERVMTGRAARGQGARLPGAVALGLLALLGGACAVLLRSGAIGGLPGASLLLGGCGFLVAAVFAYASLEGTPDQRAIVGPLYAADLAGGCAGSLVAGLVAIPMLGLPATALGAASLAALALVCV
jgi:spermidine synthase